ncbi:MAG TPA: ATP-binding protein [Planctomycetota bacterium]|nr:ATP-binding protein [Planctomycetota bacterium]
MNEQGKAQDYAFLTNLVAGLVHEIKNPLTTINLNLQLLKEDWHDAESQREKKTLRKLDVIQTETQRLKEILDDFLKFVRIDDLDLKPLDINALLDEIVEFLSNELKQRNVEVIRFYDYNLPRCAVDVKFMKQAFLNILLNAGQAIETNGQIMVRTSRDGDRVRVEITDTGAGMPPETLAKIFTPWFSTKASGTGLGLPTTRRIIEEHGGSIQVQSEPQRGTSVVIHLIPRIPQDNETAEHPTL